MLHGYFSVSAEAMGVDVGARKANCQITGQFINLLKPELPN